MFPWRKTIQSPADAAELVTLLKGHAAEMIRSGTPIEILATAKKPSGTEKQRRFMWILLKQISEQVFINGRRFDADTWDVYWKQALLPEESERGVPKWRYLPTGERTLLMGFSDLNKSERITYLEALQAEAATEHGVQFSVNPNEYPNEG